MIEYVLMIYIAGSNFLIQGVYATQIECLEAARIWSKNLPSLTMECRGRWQESQ